MSPNDIETARLAWKSWTLSGKPAHIPLFGRVGSTPNWGPRNTPPSAAFVRPFELDQEGQGVVASVPH